MANLRLLLLILLCLILIPVKGPDTRIIFIDVGQGDGIYIDAGEDILIDCGSSSTKKIGKYTLEPFLKSQRIGSIEKLFITHADSDHTNGIQYLGGTNISVRELYLPVCAKGDENYDELIEAICGHADADTDTGDSPGIISGVGQSQGMCALVHYIKAGDVIPLEKGTLTCMSPQSDPRPGEMNDQSLILLYRQDDFSALFTGDASKACEHQMLCEIDSGSLPAINDLTVLKAGHHGSNTSTSDELLRASTPLISVLSYGQGNRYGHPHPETVDLLDRYHVHTLHTAKSGAVTLTTDGMDTIHISQFCHDD